MSYIHYKLITNQNYEKITFDGVSLNVNELKKLILEKKFRKSMNSSAAAAHNSNSLAGAVVSAAQLRKMFDVDLEITNVDTNEVYKNDNDSIPKNSRVQIKRVVRNSGPALAGGTITQTHQESERLNSIRIRQQQERERSISSQMALHPAPSSQRDENSSASSSPLIDDLGPISNDLKSNVVEQQKSDPAAAAAALLNDSSNLLYSDFFNPLDSNASAATASKSPSANNSFSDILTDDSHLPPAKTIIDVGAKSISNSQVLPPVELLCPFEDQEKRERHLIRNAVIVPCCGYFICCENCIREKLQKNICIECPYETCLQEITSNHRLTPYKPTREKVNAYLARVGDEAPSSFSSSLFEIDPKEHPVMKLAPSNLEQLAPATVDTKLKPSQVSGLKIIVKTAAINAINCSPTPALTSNSAPIEKLDELENNATNSLKNEQPDEQEAEKLDLGIAESPKSLKSVSDVSETSSHKSSKRSSRSSSSDSSSSSRSSSTSSSTSSSSSSRSSVSSKEDAETNKEEVKKTEKADDSKQRSDSESKTAVKEMNHASIQPSNPDNSSISNSFTHNQQFQINRNLNRPGASAAAATHPGMLATAQQPMYQDAASHLNQQPFRYIHPNQMMQAAPMNAYQNPAAFDYNQAAAAANYQQYGAHYQEPYMNHSGFIRAPYQAPMMPAHYMQGQPRFQPNQNFNPYVQQQAMQQPPMQYVNTPNGVIRVMANGYAQPPPFNYQGGMFSYQGQMNPMHSQVPHQQLPPPSMYDTSSSHNNRLAMPHSSQHPHHIQHAHADKRDSSTYAKRSRSRSRSRSPKHHRSGKTPKRSSRSPTSRHYKALEHSSSSSQHHRSSYKERDERSRRSKTKKRHSRSRSKSYRSRSRSRSRRDDELRREKRHRASKRFKEDKSKSRSTSRNRSPGRTHRNSSRPSQEALSSQTAHRPLSTLDMPVSHTDSNPRSSSPSGREQKQSKTSDRKSNGTTDESRKEETVNTKENDEAYNKERAYQKLSNRLFKNSRRRESIQASQVEIPVGLEEQKVEEENSLELKSQLSTDSSDDPNKNRIVILLKDKTETVKSSSSSMQIKPVKSTSHSTIPNIKITVHNQKETTTTNGASKPVSTPTTPTKKSTPKRRVYMNQQLISSPQKIASSILPSKTTTTIVTPTLVKQESTLEEENKSPIDDEKSRPAFEEESKDDSDDLRPISSTSTNTEEEYLDISIDEKDTSIIV